MNAVIILVSYHHKNTEKVAHTIAAVLAAKIAAPNQIDPDSLKDSVLLGFGSGIYFGKHDKSLLAFADKLPQANGQKTFLFSTSGQTGKENKMHKPLREKLQAKGYKIIGEFNCAGFDTYGVLKIGGGIQKGHPNEADLKAAEAFAQNLKQQV
jgi:flavodoxin